MRLPHRPLWHAVAPTTGTAGRRKHAYLSPSDQQPDKHEDKEKRGRLIQSATLLFVLVLVRDADSQPECAAVSPPAGRSRSRRGAPPAPGGTRTGRSAAGPPQRSPRTA